VNNSNLTHWSNDDWEKINHAVVLEVGQVRIAQKILPTMTFTNHPTEVTNDVINFGDREDGEVSKPMKENKSRPFSIDEGRTLRFAEIYQQYTMTTTQVDKQDGIEVCKTLARMAAKAAALREDAAFFSGQQSTYPPSVMVDRLSSMRNGLLGEAGPDDADDLDANRVSKPILVEPPAIRRPGILFGENVFSAVASGISKLVSKAQAPG
jgi:hypothetical protein